MMRKKIEAAASVYFNEEFYKLVTMSIGMLLYAEPSVAPHFLPPETDDVILGMTLRLALSASQRVSVEDFQKIFHSSIVQEQSKAVEIEAMQKYGYKTRRAMYRNMMCCWVELVDEKIRIQPTHHKSLDGYSGISKDGPEIQLLPVAVSDTDLGAALREGFKRCTSSIG